MDDQHLFGIDQISLDLRWGTAACLEMHCSFLRQMLILGQKETRCFELYGEQ